MENTSEGLKILPNELIILIISFIEDTETILNIASTSKRYNELLHSKKFWCQLGCDEFAKYAALCQDQLPSYVVATIIYSKTLQENICCANDTDLFLTHTKLIMTSTDKADLSRALTSVQELCSCFFCDVTPLHKIIFSGLVPKYVSLASSDYYALQYQGCSMLKQLATATFHHINSVVQENGIPVLVSLLQCDSEVCVKLAAETLSSIVANYPLVRESILGLVLVPAQRALRTSIQPKQISAFDLLTSCLTHSRCPDPLILAGVIERIIELFMNPDSRDSPHFISSRNSATWRFLAQVVAVSQKHPEILKLVLDETLLQKCFEKLPSQPDVLVFVTATNGVEISINLL
eukprot:TRINITY_DN11132_c0_g1_i1.p1 TRINITY_DN11132_c0_g1~~TRINITY_DN11132_c0_g1_i1.p1  ORF type:complete len:349 (+),score=-20.94 TRINITY_DN11132_c0_g1_i1:2-1048(+)